MLSASSVDHLKIQPGWIILVCSLGFLSLFKHSIIPLLKWIFITFLRAPKNLKKCYGSWALITGSTDGIGKAFAYELARKGLNLILVSRNLHKLMEVSDDLKDKHPGIKIVVFAIDLSGDLRSGLRELEGVIKGLDVGVLINNAGVTYPGASFFHEVDEKVWMDLVKVNLRGTSMVTRVVLPGMVERKKGLIVNIGSGAAIVVPSHPLYAIYAATKAYVDQLSRCLYVEYKGMGIDVQCQVPLYVSTKMASNVALIEKASLFVPQAKDYAKAAVGQMGYEPRCTPYWAHSLQWCFCSMLPEAVLDAWRLSIGIRRRRLSLIDQMIS